MLPKSSRPQSSVSWRENWQTSKIYQLSLNTLLPTEKQYHYHTILSRCSFFSGINPSEPFLKSNSYLRYRLWIIMFLLSICTKRVVECYLARKDWTTVSYYLGDFKIWWGHPYIANQVVFVAAVFIVPCYIWINLTSVCPKDYKWTVPFRFSEGLLTARDIHLEDKQAMESLYMKLRVNYYRSYGMMYSVIVSYAIAVFASFFIFYKNLFHVLTLGIFWTWYECYWSDLIDRNMGFYPTCLEIVTHYLILRYDRIYRKLQTIHTRLNTRTVLSNLNQVRRAMIELESIDSTLRNSNHYWRKYTMAVFGSYVPQILFEIYVCIFFDMGNNVLVFAVTLTLNMIVLMSQICIFSASVHSKAYSMRRILISIYHRVQYLFQQRSQFQGISWRMAYSTRFALQLSNFLEQYHKREYLGIHLLDFYLIDWSFYAQTIGNCLVYFLLIADMLQQ